MDIKEKLLKDWQEPAFISGAEILLRSLVLEEVECVFGYPGGAVLYIYDALHDFKGFKHYLSRHEQGAIHAADGYARASGKTGVCIATSGPGATNLVTGIATAYMDSTPMVIITGNVATGSIGTDAFQEADITGITLPITKHNYLVRDASMLASTIQEAFYLASTGRKGPVLIDIPKDVSAQKAWFRPKHSISIRGYQPTISPHKPQLERLIDAMKCAERPLVLAGGGIIYAEAYKELSELIEKTNIPVTTTLLGIGGFSSAHPLWLGMPGMHGTYASNMAIQNCDLLINLGARFDDRVTMKLEGFAPHAKIAHMDIDPAEIGKNIKTDLPIVADLKSGLEDLNMLYESIPSKVCWIEQINKWREDQPLKYSDSNEVLKPQWVIEMIHRLTQGNAIVTTDVGQHQMWTAQYYKFNRPRALITSGGLGTMGFGFPAAIGAKLAYPDQIVVSINGDGGIQMCAQELAVCAIHQIPVKIVILNNTVLGMVRQWQEIIHDERFSHIDLSGSPNFVKLAEAYGIKGLTASTKEQAIDAFTQALNDQGPVLIEFMVNKNENVYPMVTQGNTLDVMLLGDEIDGS